MSSDTAAAAVGAVSATAASLQLGVGVGQLRQLLGIDPGIAFRTAADRGQMEDAELDEELTDVGIPAYPPSWRRAGRPTSGGFVHWSLAGTYREVVVGGGRNPARVTVTSLRTAALDGRLLAVVRACRQ